LDEKFIKGRAWVIYWHSVGFPVFFALVGLACTFFSMIIWVLNRVKKKKMARQGLPTQILDGDIKAVQSFILVSLVVGCLALGVAGWPTFKENCGQLKQRMFMVIR
jgi:hypothetical protein